MFLYNIINRWLFDTAIHFCDSENRELNTLDVTKLQNIYQPGSLYIGWSNVTYLWSQYDRHLVGQHRRTVRSDVVKICRVIRIKLNQLV